MRIWKWAGRIVLIGSIGGLSLAWANGDDTKYSIKDVMKEAHKSGLYKKVGQGKATKEEKEKLVAFYTALAKETPPKGDADAWKKQTEEMLAAAKGSLDGDKDAEAKLLKIVNCAGCHKQFK
jgi:hypothetical protein